MHPVHPHPQKGLRQHRTMKAAALCANRSCSMLRYCPGGMCMFSAFFRDLRTEFAGLGTHPLPIRIFNPGELVVIRLKGGK